MRVFMRLSQERHMANEGMDSYLPDSGRIDTAVWMHYLDAN